MPIVVPRLLESARGGWWRQAALSDLAEKRRLSREQGSDRRCTIRERRERTDRLVCLNRRLI